MASRVKQLIKLGLLLCLLFVLFPVNAYAYIDPGSGSYVVQMVIAILIGWLFTLKRFWQGIAAYLHKVFSGGKK